MKGYRCESYLAMSGFDRPLILALKKGSSTSMETPAFFRQSRKATRCIGSVSTSVPSISNSTPLMRRLISSASSRQYRYQRRRGVGGSPTSHTSRTETSRNPARRPSRRRPTGASRAFETASSARSLSRPLTSSCTACGLQWPSCEQTRSARLLFSASSTATQDLASVAQSKRIELGSFGLVVWEEKRGGEGRETRNLARKIVLLVTKRILLKI